MEPGLLLNLVSLVLLVVAEGIGSKAGVWLTKPLASTGFVLYALGSPKVNTTLTTSFEMTMLIGFAMGWLGDIFLIPDTPLMFQAGLISFLFGHIAFGLAFLKHQIDIPMLVASSVIVSALAIVITRRLWSFIPQDMKIPVGFYIVVISGMVSVAGGSAPSSPHPKAQLLGAVSFFVSDLMVAREAFVEKSFGNKLIGLPLYYGAQLLLAKTLY